ncbi:MAG: L-aspartate oxidase [Rhizobiales bacterium]|nr:L-aspartate oxidase [Hyphomicrobiales bacterium]
MAEAGDGIVIVGAGLAGLFTALRLAPLPVTVLTPAPLGEGASSTWAQGGIAAAVGEGDSPEAHAADTMAAGGPLVDPEVARTVASEAPDRIRDLLRYGVPFDRDLAGHFVLSREAAHSAKRIVRVSGDRAGAAIMQALIATVRATPSIRVLEGVSAHGILCREGVATGLRTARSSAASSGRAEIRANAIVLATGGIGQLYQLTTNPPHARGTGLLMALEAGATLADMEFVQFHPTAIDVGLDPAPLASEALRGEGAVLVDRSGRRFMAAHHPDADLAPRDVVARAVFAEITAGRGAFLDCRQAIGARFASAFPTIHAHCARAGIDPAIDLIPVAPAEHFHMGGIETDLFGRTSVPGLWAVGEVASTGLHGANRLASNSLLEAVVLGARVAEDIAAHHGRARPLAPPVITTPAAPQRHEPADAPLVREVRRIMTRDVGVVRTGEGLQSALCALLAIANDTRPGLHQPMARLAGVIALAALERKESTGAHYRADHPAAAMAPRHSRLTNQLIRNAFAMSGAECLP